MDRRCIASNANGEPCQAQPVRPSGYCWFHDPAIAEERAEKRREGGHAKSHKARLRKALPGEVLTPTELQGVLSKALKDVLAGELEPGRANAAAALARALLTTRETAELEDRIAALEGAVGIAANRTPR